MSAFLMYWAGICHRFREVSHIWGFYYPNRQWRYSKGERVYFRLRKWCSTDWWLGNYQKAEEQSLFQRLTFSIFSNSYHTFQLVEQILLTWGGCCMVIEALLIWVYFSPIWMFVILPINWFVRWLGTQHGRELIIEGVMPLKRSYET